MEYRSSAGLDATDYLMATKANRDALEASLEEYRAGKVAEHELMMDDLEDMLK